VRRKARPYRAGTVTTWPDEYIGVAVDNGLCRDLPEAAGETLRDIAVAAAADSSGQRTIPIHYAGPDRRWPHHPVAYLII
jgi:hypothetical protein